MEPRSGDILLAQYKQQKNETPLGVKHWKTWSVERLMFNVYSECDLKSRPEGTIKRFSIFTPQSPKGD